MQVSVPESPLTFVGRCAGTSTEKSGVNDARRAKSCWRQGHASVFEHVSVTFAIDGISRACSHQLVRHRLASFVQRSQRYVRVNTESKSWYVTPPEIAADDAAQTYFEGRMQEAADAYQRLLDAGIRPEDARYVLPEATKTALVVTMNLRELASFWQLRHDSHAQWEIRGLARAMRDALTAATSTDAEWSELVDMLMPL